MTEDFRPIPEGRYEPKMEGAEEELTSSCWKRAEEYYGYDDGTGVKIPDIVKTVSRGNSMPLSRTVSPFFT